MTTNTAMQEGYKAYQDGFYRSSCPYCSVPYEFVTIEAKAWLAGYERANDAGAPIIGVEEQRIRQQGGSDE